MNGRMTDGGRDFFGFPPPRRHWPRDADVRVVFSRGPAMYTRSEVLRPPRRETAQERLERIIRLDRDFTDEDYESLLLLDEMNSTTQERRHVEEDHFFRAPQSMDDIILEDPPQLAQVQNGDCSACCICLEVFSAGDHVYELPMCKHVFHSACVLKWFDEDLCHPKCPICRNPHPTTDIPI